MPPTLTIQRVGLRLAWIASLRAPNYGLVCATSLAILECRMVGTQFRGAPAVVTIPKNVQGSIRVEFVQGDVTVRCRLNDVAGEGLQHAATVQAAAGAHIETTPRETSFPTGRLVARANGSFLLPAANFVSALPRRTWKSALPGREPDLGGRRSTAALTSPTT